MITVFYSHVIDVVNQTGKSFEEIVKTISKAGIDAFEMDYNELSNKGFLFPYKLKKLGMPINSCYKIFDWGHNKETKDYKKVIDSLSRKGIKNLLVIPGFVSDSDDKNACMSNMASVLRECITYAEKKSVQIHMEDFDDSIAPFSTIEGLKYFMDCDESLSIAFDTGNFLYSEQDALDAFDVFKNKIGYVHCKDRSFDAVDAEEAKPTIEGRAMFSASVGSGIIPMKEIIDRLLADGYNGAFAIEHFGSLKQLDDMLASVKWLKEQGVR